MSPRRAALTVVLMVCATVSSSCSSEETAPRGPRADIINNACADDSQCGTGVCLKGGGKYQGGFCSRGCDPANDDCPRDPTHHDMFCGTAPDGSSMCARCNGFGFACGLTQLPVACSLLDDTHCDECGCPDAQVCIPGVGCRAESAVGEPCWKDSDCESRNCSAFAGVCRVAVGAACTPEDCDRRHVDKDKPTWSFCDKECTADQCPVSFCSSYAPEVYATLCTQCPALTYCPADMPNASGCNLMDRGRYTCAQQYVKRETGRACTHNRECSSQDCWATSACDDQGLVSERCWTVGYCTASCMSDGDCSAGSVCASRCTGATCELRCMRSCERAADCPTGYCEALRSAQGAEVRACDPRERIGEYCKKDDDCQSGRCSAELDSCSQPR